MVRHSTRGLCGGPGFRRGLPGGSRLQARILYQLVSKECNQPVGREGKGGHTQRSQQSQTRRTTSDTDNIVDIGGLVWFRGKPPPSGNSPRSTQPADVWTRCQSSKRTHCDCVLASERRSNDRRMLDIADTADQFTALNYHRLLF